jgi:hypothetical protein
MSRKTNLINRQKRKLNKTANAFVAQLNEEQKAVLADYLAKAVAVTMPKPDKNN